MGDNLVLAGTGHHRQSRAERIVDGLQGPLLQVDITEIIVHEADAAHLAHAFPIQTVKSAPDFVSLNPGYSFEFDELHNVDLT